MRTSIFGSLNAAALVLVLAACAGDADRASIAGPLFDEHDEFDECAGGQCVECSDPPLFAYAGADQEVAAGNLVTLSGYAEGGSAAFFCSSAGVPSVEWTQLAGPTVTLSDVYSLTPTFTAPGSAAVLTFRLTATDYSGQVSDEVSIAVLMSIPDQFTSLIALVNGAGLEKNTAKSLVSLLQNAAAGYAKGDVDGALDKLNSFIAQVSALKKKIPQQNALIAAANALVTAISAL